MAYSICCSLWYIIMPVPAVPSWPFCSPAVLSKIPPLLSSASLFLFIVSRTFGLLSVVASFLWLSLFLIEALWEYSLPIDICFIFLAWIRLLESLTYKIYMLWGCSPLGLDWCWLYSFSWGLWLLVRHTQMCYLVVHCKYIVMVVPLPEKGLDLLYWTHYKGFGCLCCLSDNRL